MNKINEIYDDWEVLLSAFPKNWKEIGTETKATNYMRGFSSAEVLIRILLLHIGKGYSLKETSVRAKNANLVDVSHVALFKRLKKSELWLKSLCLALLEESGINVSIIDPKFNLRIVDGSIVKEPGKTGSEWRFLFSFRLPSLNCDQFDLTPVTGTGTGEAFNRLRIRAGDHILGDRAYALSNGIAYVENQGGHVLVRSNAASLPLYKIDGQRINILDELSSLKRAGNIFAMEANIKDKRGKMYQGRFCVLRKSEDVIQKTIKKLKRRASKKGHKLKSETIENAKFVMVFTTFSNKHFNDKEILELYRLRWQIELAIKRLKSIIQLGHIPKGDDNSCKAWLYGKLFLGLLTEKLSRIGSSFSPWGYQL